MTEYPMLETDHFSFSVKHESIDGDTYKIRMPTQIILFKRTIVGGLITGGTLIPIKDWDEFVKAVNTYDMMWKKDGAKALREGKI